MIIVPGQAVGLIGDGGNNEVATFTDDRHIQGEANLTFDGSTLTVTGALTVGVDDTGHDVTFYGATSGKKITWDESEDTLLVTNETAFTFGTDKDVAIAHRATSLAADTAWSIGSTVIIEGTDDHPGVAANSFVISNVTNDGDIMFAVSDAGNSIGALKLKGADGSVNVHKDLIVNSSLQVATIDYTDGDLAMTIADGGGVTFSQTMTATNIEMGDGGYIRFGGDYPMIDDNGYLQFITATNADFWWTHGSQNVMQLDTSAYQLHLGAGVAADTALIFDGNAVDYHIGLDDSGDRLNIGWDATLSSSTSIWQFYKTGTLHTAAYYNPTFVSDGSSSVVSALDYRPAITGASGDTTYQTQLDISYGTITTQAVSETIGTVSTMKIVEPTITVGSGSSITNAVTVYIESAPTEGTNNYALWVDSGVSRFDGQVLVGTSATGFNTAYDDLIVGSGSGDTGMFIYSGSSDIGGLMFHDAANTNLSGFVTYDHNIDYMYFGTGGLGRISMYGGASPVLRIGIGQTYDTTLLFDGNAIDYYIGLDDSADDLVFGTGSTVGSDIRFMINTTGVFVGTAGNPTLDRPFRAHQQSSLGETAGDLQPIASITGLDSNADKILFDLRRVSNGSDWQTAELKIQREVDTTHMGYVSFGHGDTSAIGFGYDTTEYFSMKTAVAEKAFTISAGTAGDAVLYILADTDNSEEGDNPKIVQRQDATGVEYVTGILGNGGDIFTGTQANSTYFQTNGSDRDFYWGYSTTFRMHLDNGTGDLWAVGLSAGSLGVTIGDGSAEDTSIVFDGNEVDFHIGLDDSANELTFGTGTALGSNNAFRVSSTPETIFPANLVILDDVEVKWGNAPNYKMYYDNTNTRWAMWTTDTNGSGGNEDIIRIEDGQKSIDANTTWDANVFDIYDDAMLLASSISPTADAYDFGKGVFKRGREALIEVGILKEYEDGWVGYNDQRMAALLAGGIYQTRQLVDEMKEEIHKLRKQVTALGG